MKIKIVDMTLRDGLQNESQILSVDQRLELAKKLIEAGSVNLEVGAFVRDDRVPQMAQTDQLLTRYNGYINGLSPAKRKNLKSAVLVPNEKGMQQALQYKASEVAVFTATSEKFTQNNVNCTIKESLERFEPVFKQAKKNKIKVRGYISTVFGCPFEGETSVSKAVWLTQYLFDKGCYEVSLGDTIGVADPKQVEKIITQIDKKTGLKKIAGHFHDTRGAAIANILKSLELGVRTFDASLGGLGGCPYAPGAAGNVALEDVVYMLERMKIQTGIDLNKLAEANLWLSQIMQKPLRSKVSIAMNSKR